MRPRTAALIAAGAVLALLALANAHLVYVAITSQPDCVAHSKSKTNDPSVYRAARPAC